MTAGSATDDSATDGPASGGTPEPPKGHRPQVVVSVGTDHHPFDRLIGWLDRWARAHPDVSVLVQRGTAAKPANLASVEMVPYDELVSAMATAEVVVVQAGPATIMDARSVGRSPIVVPRLPEHGEIVDGHQLTFARWMAERGLVSLAEDEESLVRQLDEALRDPESRRIEPDAGQVAQTLEVFAATVDPLLARGRR